MRSADTSIVTVTTYQVSIGKGTSILAGTRASVSILDIKSDGFTHENALLHTVASKVFNFVKPVPFTHLPFLPRPTPLRRLRPSLSTPVRMSIRTQSARPSSDNFTAIFNAASSEYQRVTGKRLDTHPLATQLGPCNSPEAVSKILLKQAQAFSKFSKNDEKLMSWLDPTIQILLVFSATLGEGIGLVSHLIHFS